MSLEPSENPTSTPAETTPQAMPPPPLLAPGAMPAGFPQATGVQRPASALVIGILLLVFAAHTLFGLVVNIIQRANDMSGLPASVYLVSQIGLVVALLKGPAQVVTGIALIRFAWWGRTAALATVAGQLVLDLLVMGLSLSYMSDMFAASIGNAGGPPQAAGIARTAMGVGMAMGVLFVLGVNITLGALLLTRNTTQAFAARRAEEGRG